MVGVEEEGVFVAAGWKLIGTGIRDADPFMVDRTFDLSL